MNDFRTMTNPDGKELEAKVLEYNPHKSVTIELRDGRKLRDVSVEFFSAEDRQFFKDWEKARLTALNDAMLEFDTDLLISVKTARDDDLNDKGDPDNREVTYEPGLTIDNREKDYSFKKVEGTLVIIGQSVLKNSEYHILYRENFSLDLPAGGRTFWKGKPFTNIYDEYPDNGSAFGAEYEGYLVVLRDKDGNVKITKASKSSWESDYNRILKANMRQGHSRDFTKSFAKTVH